MKKGGSWVRAADLSDPIEHADVRVDTAGSVDFTNADPATTTGSAQVTGGGTTTTVFTSQTLTAPATVLATRMTASFTTSGTPDAGTIELRRAGTVVTSTPATTSATLSTANMVTVTGSPVLDVRVNGLSATAGTATINFNAITFSRENRW